MVPVKTSWDILAVSLQVNCNMGSNAINYFSEAVVERAVANYFATHGVTEEVRDRLMSMEIDDSEEFFEMVSAFVEYEASKQSPNVP